DVGACTGGFTDVLLQADAKKVYSIDVGYGQLDWKLRNNERVVVMERTNARYLEQLDDPIDLVVIDVSFISLRIILTAVKGWLSDDGQVVALIKPQFEASRQQVGKGGIIRDDAVRQEVVTNVLNWMIDHDWSIQGLTQSSIQGSDGNIEFLVHLKPSQSMMEKISLTADEWYFSAVQPKILD
ncbi:MAG: TlyA family RNA methyltransferase, partial [Chloroflexota bacterium]